MRAMRPPSLRIALLLVAMLLVSPRSLSPQEVGRFLAGAATGFALHEGAHVASGLAFGSAPGLRRISFGPIPFFAVTHERVSPRREYIISSAGFWSQQATSETLLTRNPTLRHEDAPFLKGMFAFHLVTSTGYGIVAISDRGPLERDTYGMAVSADLPEPVIGAVVLVPAILDALRYYFPEKGWLRWAGRGVKLGGALIVLRASEGSE